MTNANDEEWMSVENSRFDIFVAILQRQVTHFVSIIKNIFTRISNSGVPACCHLRLPLSLNRKASHLFHFHEGENRSLGRNPFDEQNGRNKEKE